MEEALQEFGGAGRDFLPLVRPLYALLGILAAIVRARQYKVHFDFDFDLIFSFLPALIYKILLEVALDESVHFFFDFILIRLTGDVEEEKLPFFFL